MPVLEKIQKKPRRHQKAHRNSNGRAVAPANQVVLYDISWELYNAIAGAQGDRPIQLTYADGVLEIMSPSPEHEQYKIILRRLLETMSEELDVVIGGYGSTTYQFELAKKGLEPDECYYIGDLSRVRGKKRFVPGRDPVPDLSIEIDITHRSVNRMQIYAALGVSEVWRFDGKQLQVHRLNKKSEYKEAEKSQYFPTIPVEKLADFARRIETEDDNSIVRAFRRWLRRHIGGKS